MAIQPIDKFCENLDPIVKNAVTLASVGSTVAREKTLNAAYPEAGKNRRKISKRRSHRSSATELKFSSQKTRTKRAISSSTYSAKRTQRTSSK